MYALVKIYGKQYKVKIGDTIRVAKIDSDIDKVVSFSEVFLIKKDKELAVGNPVLTNANVSLQVVKHSLGEKVKVVKFRRRKHYMRTYGHRQKYTDVLVKSIDYKG